MALRAMSVVSLLPAHVMVGARKESIAPLTCWSRGHSSQNRRSGAAGVAEGGLGIPCHRPIRLEASRI